MDLLKLSTEGQSETIEIDGKEYDLAPFNGFSITEQHGLKITGQKMQSIGGKLGKGKETAEDVAALEVLIDDQFSRIAGTIPEDVRAKIGALDKQRVVNAYFLAFGVYMEPLKKEASASGQHPASRRSRGSTKGSRSKSG